jgi:RNA polymerase sigma-70 factor (sigma-E family)
MHSSPDLAVPAPGPPPAPPVASPVAVAQPPTAREAIVSLYGTHYDGLVRLAYLVAHDPTVAEDLVQEAFVRLYGAWGRVRDPVRAPAYLRSTVINLARGRARHHRVTLRRRPPAGPDAASAEDGALGRERTAIVLEALRRLPARQRECLVLRHYLDQSESEIARTLRISVGAVRTHLRRGLAALERQLKGLR